MKHVRCLLRLTLTTWVCCVLPLYAWSAVFLQEYPELEYAIDQLIAHGTVRHYVYGQRPFSAVEVADMLVQTHNYCADTSSCPPIISHYVEQLTSWLAGVDAPCVLNQLALQQRFTNYDSRLIPASNGVGRIRGSLRSMQAYEMGRQWVDGYAVAVEGAGHCRVGSRGHVVFQPRLWSGAGLHDSRQEPRTGYDLIEAYGNARLAGMHVSIGRRSMLWGHGSDGGLLLSRNARPLDALTISSAKPFYHPWFLRHLGPSKYTFFVANLGNDRAVARPWMVGFAANAQPFTNFEFGGFHTYIFGGAGVSAHQWWDPLTEFFFVRAGGMHRGSRNVADHRAGINLRFTIPQWRNAVWYYEGIFEDLGRESVIANFVDVSAHTVGLAIPRLRADGSLGLRIVYRFIPALMYRHTRYTDGYTLNGSLIGDPLGPDAQSVQVVLRMQPRREVMVRASTALEWRDSDLYVQTRSSRGGSNRVQSIYNGPTEMKARARVDAQLQLDKHMYLRPSASYEYVRNHRFINSKTRHHVRLGVDMQWRFSP